MKITELRVNHIEEPKGYSYDPASFSWKVEEAQQGKMQKYAEITVRKGTEILYDSGRDANADSLDYPVRLILEPRTRYDWTVSVTADSGEKAEASSYFETGKMNEEWTGRWITPGEKIVDTDSMAGYILEKNFEVHKAAEARLYLCGLGVYECYINGQKVGGEYLAPGYHSYDFHLQTSVYDVTEYLIDGENHIELWLGEGWFKSRLGFDGGIPNLYGDRLYAIAELYVDGELCAATGEGWMSRISPVAFSGIYDGEIYDARLEDTVAGCPAVCAAPEKCGPLTDRYNLPIVKKEAFRPVEVITSPKGETILDFGQNLTGWTEFDSALPKDAKLRLTACEILQDGCFYHENLRLAKTEFIYISNGRRAHVRPHFTFYGFRYMLAELQMPGEGWKALPKECEAYHFTAFHLRSDFDQIGWIVTGNEKVNQLFSNALWGQKDNFLDVPTDCPQRDERLGWTGDAQVFSETACYNMYMPAFYRKYLWDMRAEQSITDGAVPNVVPRIKQGMIAECGSCPWADAGVIIPWNVYLHYGSKTLLAETYPGMKAWVDYERKLEEAEEGGHLIKSGFHFADWLALDNEQPGPFGATDPLYIASAYYYRDADIIAKSAEILGYAGDAAEYRKLAQEIKSALLEKYFDENGLCLCHTQTGSAIAVMFGITDGRAAEEGNALSRRVTDNRNHLNTGFVGTPILCPALTETGHHGQAVDLLLNEDYPGWLYSVDLGATTIWERWNSVLPDGHMNPEGMNSLNHYSYGSIEAWMYGYTCGIREMEPGFRKAIIEPHPDSRLGFAKCRLDTAAGTYESNWTYGEDGRVSYEIKVPFGGEAQIRLPGQQEIVVKAGSYLYQI
ncbi:MAG: family 78 glycoside hydrolase catalytic domain [Eubacteriales bacterium]|nr:family 78 glycoside hydrolase catalytic domain [Eubacteriales bacterium]